MKETTQTIVTSAVKGEGTSAFDKNHYMKQARLLLAQMVRVRKKAKYLRKQTNVSALNSLIRTLSQLMRAIGESKVDKDKVEQILGMLKKKAEDIDAELVKGMRNKAVKEQETTAIGTTVPRTRTTEEEITTVCTTVPTTETTGETTTKQAVDQISAADRTVYTKQAKSLIVDCIKLRKKASQTGQPKYVMRLNSYIKALVRLLKQVRKPTFEKEQVEDALKLLKTKVSEGDTVLEQSISTESLSLPDEIVKETTPFVTEVGEVIVYVPGMKP